MRKLFMIQILFLTLPILMNANLDKIQNDSTQITEWQGIKIQNIEEINTPDLDFSPVLYGNGLIISSTRNHKQSQKNWRKQKYSDLFFFGKEGDHFGEAQPLSEVNDRFHDGTATFNQAGDYMIFTKNNRKGKNKNLIHELQLYEAHLIEGKWINIKSLSINSKKFGNCHPTLSADGKTLYFSSSRPNGFGGMDLYVSKKIDGDWSTPINLGSEVNSEGNEIFPHVYNNRLYFSSNGHSGVGGLDIFFVEKNKEENMWLGLKNIGKPFNSPKDDFGFIIENENESGYLTSNRKGGKGEDDIYAWSKDESLKPKEEKTPKKLSDKCITIKGSVVNQEFESPISFAMVELFNRCTGEISSFKTDKNGQFEFSISNDCEFEVISKKERFEDGNILFSTVGKTCDNDGIIEKEIPMRVLDIDERKTSSSFQNENTVTHDYGDLPNGSPVTKESLIEYFTGEKNSTIETGQKFILKNIYYNYNQHEIRSDAGIELDYLANLMKMQPSMEIELTSHTDSRGKEEYNIKLSQKRAESAMAYLLQKGIDSSRIHAVRGMGEAEMAIPCVSNCSDEVHQANRRTEITVVKN